MKLKVSKEEFQKKLSDIRGIVESKGTMPILTHFLLVARKEGSLIQATNLETYLRQPLAAEVEEEGSLCIPAKKMLELTREIEGEMTLETEAETWLRVKAGTSKFKMVCLSATEYPAWPPVKEVARIDVESKTLADMIEKSAFAAGEDDKRYVMNGILFHLRPADKALVLVGTDGHRMSVSGRAISFALEEELKVVVQRKNVYELKRFLDVEGKVSVLFGKDHVVFTKGTVDFMARLIEGTYPNYSDIVPKNGKKVLLDRELFLMAVKRASIMSNGANAVKLAFAKGSVAVTSLVTELGEARDEVAVEYAGEDLAVGLNARYLVDALSIMEGERIQMELGEPLTPVALRDGADDGYVYVMMPMRL